jgi:hypothetical protein
MAREDTNKGKHNIWNSYCSKEGLLRNYYPKACEEKG